MNNRFYSNKIEGNPILSKESINSWIKLIPKKGDKLRCNKVLTRLVSSKHYKNCHDCKNQTDKCSFGHFEYL